MIQGLKHLLNRGPSLENPGVGGPWLRNTSKAWYSGCRGKLTLWSVLLLPSLRTLSC